jgi:hypothetical protein
VVVDNLMAFCPGDINDHLPIRKLADVLEQFNRAGMAVILVHHVSEHEYSTKPMGNTAISAMARWCVRFERRGDRLLLNLHGNYGAESQLIVTAPDGTTGFELLNEVSPGELAERRERSRKQRSKETLDKNAAIAGFVKAECPGLSKNAAAKRIADKFGGAAGTHRNKLMAGAFG